MILNELFSTVYPHSIIKNTNALFQVNFLEPKTYTMVNFNAIVAEPNSPVWIIGFKRDSRMDLTKQGNAFNIFSTIIDIIKKFIEIKNPEIILFSAKEINRQDLYRKLILKFAQSNGYHLASTAAEKIHIMNLGGPDQNDISQFALVRN